MEYKSDIDSLYLQLTQLLNDKVKTRIQNSFSVPLKILIIYWKTHRKNYFVSRRNQPKRFSHELGDEFSDPAAQPLYWVSKWVDYSDKYGFGYQLCDESMGIMFNDTTKLIMFHNGL